MPFLHSKSFETRTAASSALSQIFTLVPLWQPIPPTEDKMFTEEPIAPSFPVFSVQELLHKGTLLLASSGKEFQKPTGILSSSAEVKKARREAMGRLGLDFLESVGGADEMDLDKELAVDAEPDEDLEMEKKPKLEDTVKQISPTETNAERRPSIVRARSETPLAPSPTPSAVPSTAENMSALSARERNRLKRKRKPGNAAVVVAPPPQTSGAKFAPSAAIQPNKLVFPHCGLIFCINCILRARLIASDERSSPSSRLASPSPSVNGLSVDRIVIDPSKGGAVSPKSSQEPKALEVKPGYWVWDGLVKVLEVDLFSVAWEVRHGAALALRELLKIQGKCGGMQGPSCFLPIYRELANRVLFVDNVPTTENEINHERWCNDLAAKFLCVFVLDRFGDFVTDQVCMPLYVVPIVHPQIHPQVVAPVRETVSQTLASLLLHMPQRSVLHVHSILLQMIRQDFPPSTQGKHKGRPDEKGHVWEVRHAGLLGIKYEVAVRSDLFDMTAAESDGSSINAGGRDVLRGVVDAAILGSVLKP
jgi:TATA-binding protein-associated factor